MSLSKISTTNLVLYCNDKLLHLFISFMVILVYGVYFNIHTSETTIFLVFCRLA